MKRVLAFDIGASSGRAIIGEYDGKKITMHEIHRFKNEPVSVCGAVHWDILRLFHEIKQGIRLAGKIDSIGIDTWGVDYGRLDKSGRLLGNPYHYRDKRNDDAKMLDIYDIAGIQFMQFNTVYQLMHEDLSGVDKVLLIPDLLCCFLTGNMRMEYTNASTTNLLDAKTHELSDEILKTAGIRRDIFAPMIKCGEIYGYLSDEICAELGVESVPVMAVGTHDTASAVAAIPDSGSDFAYISSGTWSLFGTLSDEPILTQTARELNFTNELGIDFRIRLLKNVMGLWLMQELQRETGMSFPELSKAAQSCPADAYLIDVDDTLFLGMGDMKGRISKAVGKELSVAQTARCIYDSLANKYKITLDNLQRITGKRYDKLYMFGGGIKDEFLCRLTAERLGIPVITCSEEATALGNIAVQIKGSADISDIIKATVEARTFI